MSRAFVKDDDGGPERPFDRPASAAPNYVTPKGLERLREALARAESEGDQRERRYYEERVASAIVVDGVADRTSVGFGATVDVHDALGAALRVRIVGEDEADPSAGDISWESPVAQALMERKVGDSVVVARPAGPITYTIDAIAYRKV